MFMCMCMYICMCMCACASYTVGPEEIYEEYFFLERALQIIDEHDPDKGPLFLNYDSHIVHSPLQVIGGGGGRLGSGE